MVHTGMRTLVPMVVAFTNLYDGVAAFSLGPPGTCKWRVYGVTPKHHAAMFLALLGSVLHTLSFAMLGACCVHYN